MKTTDLGEARIALMHAGYVVLTPEAVAGLRERITAAQVDDLDSHQAAIRLARVVGYLESQLG